jgi:transcriptional regulator of acetoin/glycerol metabolism
LAAHDWPGNLRELQHAARFALAVDTDGRISLTDLPPPLGAGGATTPPQRPAGRRATIEAALERSKWNVSAAAALLGISRATLHRHLREFGIDRPG